MKFTLQAGSEVDVLTQAELRDVVRELEERFLGQPVEEKVRPAESGVTDGTGAAVIEVYTVPPGFEFELNRLVVDADGFSPGVPFKNGAGWIDIRRNLQRLDFVNLAVGLPALSIDGKDTANVFRNGEQVEVAIFGGPANTNIRVELTGKLRRLASGQLPQRLRGH